MRHHPWHPWQSHFSWRWYQSLWSDVELWTSFSHSIVIAMVSATSAVVLGTLIASFFFERTQKWQTLYIFPMVMPEMITGLSLLLMWMKFQSFVGWDWLHHGIFPIVLAHGTVGTAYVILMIKTRLKEFSPFLEEAASDLGAKSTTIFWKIKAPLMIPSLAGAWILTFSLSFDDVVLSSFMAPAGIVPLPLLIFSRMRLGLTPEIYALTAVIICFTIGIVLFSHHIVNRYRQYL